MNLGKIQWGRAELRARPASLLWLVGLFSVVVNLLLLTGPLYMLQVYDSVLTSRSQATLVALSVVAVGLFAAMGVVDHARGRILARLGARLQDRMEGRVLSASQQRLRRRPDDSAARLALQDLEAVQRLWTSSVMVHVFDLPWAPVFLAILFAFGAPMGWLALGGAGVLFGLAVLTRSATAEASQAATLNQQKADSQAAELGRASDVLEGLGMTGALMQRWKLRRAEALAGMTLAADRAAALAALGRSLRMILQSAMLGLGAWLVLQDRLSPGAMIAGSVLLGRSLQPIEQAIGQWHLIMRGVEGRTRLAALLAATPPAPPRSALPRPAAQLEVQGLVVVPSGAEVPVLRGVSLRLEPGQTLGILGASGAGKSSLARALVGAWPAASGFVRLGGATPDQYGPDGYGRLIGYLPQRLPLFDGTVAENIARLDEPVAALAVTQAAQRAGAHDMILRLPLGYDTALGPLGGALSGGQTQLVGLARALYGNPVLLVLDEPFANLDTAGLAALTAAVRAHREAGGIAVVMAHQLAQVGDCTHLMVLEQGRVQAFGPRDAVLRDMARAQGAVALAAVAGGAS